MNTDRGMSNAECRVTARSAHAPRASRFALTLVELLVTIVILVTLLAAVLPAVSPNNEGRKIREASRQLVSLFQQAQAQAARDGRPVGVGFQDPDGDGIALEAYIIAEPPAFAGFSTGAAVLTDQIQNPNRPYNNPQHSSYVNDFSEPFNITLGFGVGGESFTYTAGDISYQLPPDFGRPGDILEVGRERFLVVADDLDDIDDTDSVPDVVDENLDPRDWVLKPQSVIAVRWLTRNTRGNTLIPPGGKAYRWRRAPMANVSPSRTAAEAIQFPRGIGVDMDPSDGNASMGIVFSPNGSIDAIYRDGNKVDREQQFVLLGQVENANPITTANGNDIDYTRYDFRGGSPMEPDDDELAQRRREVNLFNADSRWITITPGGRVVASENAIFDPRTLLFDPTDPSKGRFVDNLSGAEIDQLRTQRERFRFEAQRYARALESEGGG